MLVLLFLLLCAASLVGCEVAFSFPSIELDIVSSCAKLGYYCNSANQSLSSSGVSPVIPLIIHQSWKNKDLSTYSPDTNDWQLKNSRFTSDFLKVLWTDSDILILIEQFYPQLLQYYKQLNMNIKRADLSRYLILLRYGGVYMDLDMELHRNISELFMNKGSSSSSSAGSESPEFVTYLSKEYEYKKIPFAGNAFFGSVAGCGVLSGVIRRMQEYPNQKCTAPVDVLAHSGPVALGMEVNKRLDELRQQSATAVRGVDMTSRIRILSGVVVGNVGNNPTHAAHRRKHNWS